MQKIKAVIFDWGGVLIQDPAPSLISFCSRTLGVSSAQFKRAHELFVAEFQKGKVSESQFWQKVCAFLNVPTPQSQSLWGDAFRASYSPHKDMFSLASFLQKNGYKTALLTNTEIPAMKYFFAQKYGCFDVMTFSCLEGMRKPEKRIFELTLERLKVNAKEAVFIDDNAEYIEGAKKVGINTILFKDFEEVKIQLQSYSIPL